MRNYKFMQADVFAKRPLEGNPCAVVFDADDLDESSMLAIARETNLSETVFIMKSATGDFRARYFTPREEIPLAGHPTIATIHCLIEANMIDISQLPVTVFLELSAGKIQVDIIDDKETGDSETYKIVMHQLKPVFMRTYDAKDIFPLFSLEPSDWRKDFPIQTVSTGTPMLMIPVADLVALRKAEMNVQKYVAFKNEGDFFSPHLFCLQGITDEGTTFSRHFGIPPDTMEDPFTGSASGCMAAYLWHHRLIDKPNIVAQQGHWMHRPGQAVLEIVGEPDNIETVKLYGTAITIIEGQLRI